MKTIGLTTNFGANEIFNWVHKGIGTKRLRMCTAETLLQQWVCGVKIVLVLVDGLVQMSSSLREQAPFPTCCG